MADILEFDTANAGERVEGSGLEAWLKEAREMLKLAGPLVITQLAQMVVLTTDIVMLSRYSETALAGAGLGNTVFFLCWLIGTGPAAAVSPMVAHILGAPRTTGPMCAVWCAWDCGRCWCCGCRWRCCCFPPNHC